MYNGAADTFGARRLVMKSSVARLATLLVGIALFGCQPNTPPAATGSQQPSETAAVSARAALYEAKTRYEYPDAIARLEQAVADGANDATTRFALVYGYLKTGRYDKALPLADGIEDADLSASDKVWLQALQARAADDPRREIAAWQRVVATYPADRWAWYELAVARSTVEDYPAAAHAAAQALSLVADPAKWEASWIYYLQAKALFRAGRYEQAVAAGTAGRENQTTWRSTYYRTALAQIAAGDAAMKDTFVDEYRDISTREGRNNTSYTEANLALAFYELGDFERGITHAREAYELDQSGYQSWALAYNLAESGRVEDAMQIMERAAVAFPEDAHVQAAKGWVLFRLGRHEDALAAVTNAQGLSARRVHYIQRMRTTIAAALADPDGAEPERPWLG